MAEKGETVKMLVFATIVSVVAGTALLFAGVGLKSRIEMNIEVEKKGYVMRALGVAIPKGSSPKAIIELYKKSVAEETINGVQRLVYREGGAVKSYAFDVAGMGLWAPMHAYLAVEPDLCTVKQITFYKHEETPGLGAEITKEFFTKQFVGKKMTSPCDCNPCDEKQIVLRVRKRGTADKKLEVDGITGATMTTEGVDKLVTAAVKNIVKTRGGTAAAPRPPEVRPPEPVRPVAPEARPTGDASPVARPVVPRTSPAEPVARPPAPEVRRAAPPVRPRPATTAPKAGARPRPASGAARPAPRARPAVLPRPVVRPRPAARPRPTTQPRPRT